jgi:hypothetical protein
MTEMSSFSSFTVEMDDKTNLALTTYTVSFNTQVPIENGDTLFMTFPKEISLPTSAECIEGDGFDEIDCSSTGNYLSVEFEDIDDSDGIGSFSFQISSITNPGTTSPTSQFSGVYIQNSSNKKVLEFDGEISLYTKYAAVLSDFSIE